MTPLCPIPPAGFGSPDWIRDRQPLVDVGATKVVGTSQTAEQWADDYLWRHADEVDLRALGFCRHCGRAGQLEQVGRCVYWSSCDHYRAQGELRRMLPYLDKARTNISPERRAALLALIGRT